MAGLLSSLLCVKACAVCLCRNVISKAPKNRKPAAMRVRDGCEFLGWVGISRQNTRNGTSGLFRSLLFCVRSI